MVFTLFLLIILKISAASLLQSELCNICEGVPKIVLLLCSGDWADHSAGVKRIKASAGNLQGGSDWKLVIFKGSST